MDDPGMVFDLNVKDADRRLVLEDIFAQAGRALVIDELPEGVVTVHAADLSFHDALKLVLPEGYQAIEREPRVYHIRRAA